MEEETNTVGQPESEETLIEEQLGAKDIMAVGQPEASKSIDQFFLEEVARTEFIGKPYEAIYTGLAENSLYKNLLTKAQNGKRLRLTPIRLKNRPRKDQDLVVEFTLTFDFNALEGVGEVVKDAAGSGRTSAKYVHRVAPYPIPDSEYPLFEPLGEVLVNAVEHNADIEDLEIIIHSYFRDGVYLLEVEDNGHGMAQEKTDTLFSMDYDPTDERSRKCRKLFSARGEAEVSYNEDDDATKLMKIPFSREKKTKKVKLGSGLGSAIIKEYFENGWARLDGVSKFYYAERAEGDQGTTVVMEISDQMLYGVINGVNPKEAIKTIKGMDPEAFAIIGLPASSFMTYLKNSKEHAQVYEAVRYVPEDNFIDCLRNLNRGLYEALVDNELECEFRSSPDKDTEQIKKGIANMNPDHFLRERVSSSKFVEYLRDTARDTEYNGVIQGIPDKTFLRLVDVLNSGMYDVLKHNDALHEIRQKYKIDPEPIVDQIKVLNPAFFEGFCSGRLDFMNHLLFVDKSLHTNLKYFKDHLFEVMKVANPAIYNVIKPNGNGNGNNDAMNSF